MAELAQLQTKTVLVPAAGEWDDEFSRAERMVREQQTFRVFRGNTPAELASLAAEILTEWVPNTSVTAPPGGGGRQADL